MQIHGPNASSHMKMLSNSFVSHVDLDSVMERIDLEMAVNLGTVADVNAPSNHFLNLNCQYNFKPVNFDFLVLSRLEPLHRGD